MKVELKLKQDIQVYDLVTTFAVSAPAPGLQRLCTFAQDRGGRIQSSDLEEEFGLKPGAARNLYQNGIMTEVWDAEGRLTENGLHTIQTGEVMVKEVGAIRAWVFEHQATGPVLLHADRIDRLPKGDAEPQARVQAPRRRQLQVERPAQAQGGEGQVGGRAGGPAQGPKGPERR